MGLESWAGLVETQLRGGAGPAGSLRPLESNLCLTGRLGSGEVVSGIWRSSLMAGGTLGEVTARSRGSKVRPAAWRRFARSSFTVLGGFPYLQEDAICQLIELMNKVCGPLCSFNCAERLKHPSPL